MKGRGKYGPYLAAGVTAFAVIAAAILLFFLLEHFSAIRSLLETIGYILRPICYGIVLAFLLLPVHRRILAVLTDQCQGIRDPWGKKKNILSAISILLSLIFAFLVLYVLLAMVLPQLYWSLVGLFEALPGYFQSVQQWLTTFLADNPDIQQAVLSYYRTAGAALNQWLSSDLIPNLESASSTLAWLRSELLPQLTGVVSGVSTVVLALVNLLKDIIVAVIVSVYLLARKDVFAAQSKKILYSMFPTRVADLLVEESRSAYRILSGFINGTLVDSFIVGVICLICFTVFQFPYPMLLAVIIGVTNVIPFFGPFIGAIPSGLLILLVSPRQCLYFVIFIFVLQQLDGNILHPKILGSSVGLASFWVLFAVLLFGGLFGFVGMVLGVPVFAMFYSVVSRLVNRGLKKRGLPLSTEEYLGKTGPLAPERHPPRRSRAEQTNKHRRTGTVHGTVPVLVVLIFCCHTAKMSSQNRHSRTATSSSWSVRRRMVCRGEKGPGRGGRGSPSCRRRRRS